MFQSCLELVGPSPFWVTQLHWGLFPNWDNLGTPHLCYFTRVSTWWTIPVEEGWFSFNFCSLSSYELIVFLHFTSFVSLPSHVNTTNRVFFFIFDSMWHNLLMRPISLFTLCHVSLQVTKRSKQKSWKRKSQVLIFIIHFIFNNNTHTFRPNLNLRKYYQRKHVCFDSQQQVSSHDVSSIAPKAKQRNMLGILH